MTLLEKARRACMVTTDYYDEDILDHIETAKLDLGIAGVTIQDDALVNRAIIAYVVLHFCSHSPQEYDYLTKSYEMMKGNLRTATGYTDWSDT